MNRRLPDRAWRLPAGFTLIEVMVALMIVGIALPALMFQLGTQLDGTQVINNRTQAAWIAQDQLALLHLRQAAGENLPAGEWQGESANGGRQWYWKRTAEPTPAPGVLRHTIRVYDAPTAMAAADQPLISVDAYLMAAPPGVINSGGAP